MPWTQVKPVVDYAMRGLCTKPYPGHARGCPNFGKRPTCPPACPRIEDTLDLANPVFAVYNVFDLASHVARMRAKHPDWSWRQLVCCLYWQPAARKALHRGVENFYFEYLQRKGGWPGWRLVSAPEGQGVNVTATMKAAGVELEWPPVTLAYQVAIVGHRRETNDG